jgi:flagellar assembly factor FliW
VSAAGPLVAAEIGTGSPQPRLAGSDTVDEALEAVPVDARAADGSPADGDLPELELVRPLPGFPDLTRYVLVRLSADGWSGPGEPSESILYELRSVEQPLVRFLVAVPTAFFPHYCFDLDESTCAELCLTAAEEALVLVLLTIGDDTASTTANLLAPVVINSRTRCAAQVILSGTDWPVRAAVV